MWSLLHGWDVLNSRNELNPWSLDCYFAHFCAWRTASAFPPGCRSPHLRTATAAPHEFTVPCEPWAPGAATQRACSQPCPGAAVVESPRSSGSSARAPGICTTTGMSTTLVQELHLYDLHGLRDRLHSWPLPVFTTGMSTTVSMN